MPITARLEGLLAKVEGTYGTDSVPVVGTDAVQVSERLISALTIDYAWENTRDSVVTGTILPIKPALPRGRKVQLDIAWSSRGQGAAYSAVLKPESSPLMRACGGAETVITTGGSESVSWQQSSSNHESCTIYGYAQGKLYKIVGCRGKFMWPIVTGEIVINRFRMFGFLSADPADTALPGGFVYDAPEPLANVNLGLSIGGIWTPDLLGCPGFDQGVDPQLLESANAADGIKEFDYGEANPTFTIVAKAVAAGVYDPHAEIKARTARTIALNAGATNPTAQYNRQKLNVTGAYLNRWRPLIQNGFVGWELIYKLIDWTVTFD